MVVTPAFVAAGVRGGYVFASALGESDTPRAASARDGLTLEKLFRDHVDDVHRIVARLLGPAASDSDIDDVVQQVFLAVHSALPRFRGDSKVTTWLYGIATRTVLGHLRSGRRHRRMVETLEAMTQVLPSETAHPEAQAERREALQRVWRALMQIKPKKRVVFLLYQVEGLSGREIAEALDLRPATVHTRLYHARRELDAALAREEAQR